MSRVLYEWAVEFEDEHGDILDCSYFDEPEKHRAAVYALSGADEEWCVKASMALCRRLMDPVDGEIERTYAYLDEGGKLSPVFEDGKPVPLRFMK